MELEAVALNCTRWSQNTTDRKDLGNRIINRDNKKDKNKENMRSLKKPRATQVVY